MRLPKGKRDMIVRITFASDVLSRTSLQRIKPYQKQKSKSASLRTFSDEFDIRFLYDTMVSWKEIVSVGDDLPGGRKYTHIIYKFVEGPVSEFLLWSPAPVLYSKTS